MVGYDIRDGKDLALTLIQDIKQHEILDRLIRGYEREMRQELQAEQLSQNPFVGVAHKRSYIALLERYGKFLQSIGIVDRVAQEFKVTGLSLERHKIPEVMDAAIALLKALNKSEEQEET
ncbi:MAG: hypothetical protein P8168_14750, partial [Deltaproteobacteria bacterium]